MTAPFSGRPSLSDSCPNSRPLHRHAVPVPRPPEERSALSGMRRGRGAGAFPACGLPRSFRRRLRPFMPLPGSAAKPAAASPRTPSPNRRRLHGTADRHAARAAARQRQKTRPRSPPVSEAVLPRGRRHRAGVGARSGGTGPRLRTRGSGVRLSRTGQFSYFRASVRARLHRARGHPGVPTPEAHRPAQRGVRHHLSGHPPPPDRNRRAVPGHRRRGGRVPARGRAAGAREERRGRGALPQSPLRRGGALRIRPRHHPEAQPGSGADRRAAARSPRRHRRGISEEPP